MATGGYRRPAAVTDRGMGLWVARQFAEVLHAHASVLGTALELHFH